MKKSVIHPHVTIVVFFLFFSVVVFSQFNVTTFKPWTGYAIPNGVWVAGDFNADGKTDVFHGVQNSDYAHVWSSSGNGTYVVSTFRPWPGYAIPNGQWLSGDFNGDKRTDVLHVVNNADYIHIWMSNGNGTFAVTSFQPWAGYAIPNGVWKTGDFNKDGRTDILHAVQGADYVHTWFSNGNGTFNVTTFKPWNGYAIPNGLWEVGDFNEDGRADILHAVQGADYVHTWFSNGNGSFNVTTFKPWNGYAIPNGVWHVGDFNGDGKSDIFHAVQSGGYAHTWFSNGNGSFNVTTFQPWNGYAIPNGIWMTGDVDGDNWTDIIHAVQNTNYVHVWKSKGNGNYDVITWSPWAGYAIPNGLWLTGDFNNDKRTDIFHGVLNSDYAHTWFSQFPQNGVVSIDGLEILQTVQSITQSVPLVANKGTVARAYLSLNGSTPVTVKGTLVVTRVADGSTITLNSVNTPIINPIENFRIQVKRAVTNKGLNFVIPPAFNTVGTYKYRLTTVANATSGTPVACSNCLTHIVQDDQETVGNFRIRAIGLQYTSGTQTFAPVARDFNLLESWLQRAYPANAVNYSQATIPATATWPFNCGDANAQIAAIRNLDIAGGTDKRTHYYALVSDGAGFMRGCAAIAGSPDPSAVGSGPTGPGTWGWDFDGSYGDWYGGHEIGHTLGRLHIGSGCGETSNDPAYPFTAGQLSNIDSMFLGFDVGDSRYAIPMAALPGTLWHDVMSYCQNQWVSSYTYEKMRTRINAENSLSPGASPFAGASPGSSSGFVFTKDTTPDFQNMIAAYPGPSPVIEGLKEKPPVHTALKEPITKIQAAGRMPSFASLKAAKKFTEPVSFTCNQPAILYGVYEKRKIPLKQNPFVDSNDIVYDAPLSDSNFINLIATINITQLTGKIYYTNKVNKAVVYNSDRQPSVILRLFDDRNNVLSEIRVAIRVNTDIEPGEDSTGIVDAMIPSNPAIKKIELVFRNKILDTKTFTTNENLIRLSDSARIESRRITSNENRKSGYLVSWDHKALTGATIYHVQISTDNGQSWQIIGFGLKSKSFLVEDNLLKDQKNVLIKVLANEGLETVEIGRKNIRKE